MPQQHNDPKVQNANHQEKLQSSSFASTRLPTAALERPTRFDISWPKNFFGPDASALKNSFSKFLNTPSGQEMFRTQGPASFKFDLSQAAKMDSGADGFKMWTSFLNDTFKLDLGANTLKQLAPFAAICICAVKGEASFGTQLSRRVNLQIELNTSGRASFEIRIK